MFACSLIDLWAVSPVATQVKESRGVSLVMRSLCLSVLIGDDGPRVLHHRTAWWCVGGTGLINVYSPGNFSSSLSYRLCLYLLLLALRRAGSDKALASTDEEPG